MGRNKIVEFLKIYLLLTGFVTCFLYLTQGVQVRSVSECILGGNLFAIFFIFLVYAGKCAMKIINKNP